MFENLINSLQHGSVTLENVWAGPTSSLALLSCISEKTLIRLDDRYVIKDDHQALLKVKHSIATAFCYHNPSLFSLDNGDQITSLIQSETLKYCIESIEAGSNVLNLNEEYHLDCINTDDLDSKTIANWITQVKSSEAIIIKLEGISKTNFVSALQTAQDCYTHNSKNDMEAINKLFESELCGMCQNRIFRKYGGHEGDNRIRIPTMLQSNKEYFFSLAYIIAIWSRLFRSKTEFYQYAEEIGNEAVSDASSKHGLTINRLKADAIRKMINRTVEKTTRTFLENLA